MQWSLILFRLYKAKNNAESLYQFYTLEQTRLIIQFFFVHDLNKIMCAVQLTFLPEGSENFDNIQCLKVEIVKRIRKSHLFHKHFL